MRRFDVIVIGIGGMGSAAFWHLSRRGRKVLGIDRFGVAHDRSSSHGVTRLIRKAYFERPDYAPLLHRAYERWRELETASGRRLMNRTGLLLLGPPSGEVIGGVRRAATGAALGECLAHSTVKCTEPQASACAMLRGFDTPRATRRHT